MSNSSRERTIGLGQFLAFIAVAVVVFLAWDFGHRVLDTMRLTELDASAARRLQLEDQTHQQLEQRKQDVSTDAFAEDYARENWHWTREGETLFVPIATPFPTPGTQPTASRPTPAPRPFWEELLDKIYGPAP